MKQREDAERVREVCKRHFRMLPEYTRRDLCDFAGVDSVECVSEEKGRRLGATWEPGREDYWHGAVVPAWLEKSELQIEDLQD